MWFKSVNLGKSSSPLALGAFFGIGCALIWAGWILITSFGTKHQVLSKFDLTFLRYSTSGILFLPYLLKKGIRIGPKGWIGIIIMTFCAGPPYLLMAASGMSCTSVCHVGGLLPGTMPLFTALLSVTLLRESLSFKRALGLLIIVASSLVLTGMNPFALSADFVANYSFLLLASLIWSIFTIALKYWKVDAIHAAAIVSVFSALTYAPIYFFFLEPTFMMAPTEEIFFQSFYQGVMAGIVALIFYGKAIQVLGPARGAVFVALVPVLATLMGIPFLGEFPTPVEWGAIVTLTFGVILGTGAKLSFKKRSKFSSAPD